LKESDLYKIQCAIKHFNTIGVDVHYKAPVKEYQHFKGEAGKTIAQLSELWFLGLGDDRITFWKWKTKN
jgi:type III restriction enzyme